VAEEEPIDTASADKEAKPKKKTTKQAKEKSE
jgi:hypothetical protein